MEPPTRAKRSRERASLSDREFADCELAHSTDKKFARSFHRADLQAERARADHGRGNGSPGDMPISSDPAAPRRAPAPRPYLPLLALAAAISCFALRGPGDVAVS